LRAARRAVRGVLAAQNGLSDDIVLRRSSCNLEEIRTGQLAQRNGASAQVKRTERSSSRS